MKTWHPLTGKIPADPPRAPWHYEAGDPPAEIIARMRDLWALRNGGSPKHARDLFEKAGQWLDYWRAARAGSDELDRAGVRGSPSARTDTWRSYLARADGGPDGDTLPAGAEVDAPPGDDVPLLAILAIYAAHQAILTGRRAFWGLGIELAAAAQKPISDRAIPARAEAKENLSAANSDRSSVAKERDVEMLEEIRKRIEKGVKPHNLASILARKKWRNAGNKKSESTEPVLLSRNHIQAILKTLKAEHPDVFRSTAAPKRTTRARKP